MAVTAAVVVIILAATSLLIGRGGSKPEPLGPVKPPGILVGAVPVWYDAAGLHRGDVVEKTPVTLFTDTNRLQTQSTSVVCSRWCAAAPCTATPPTTMCGSTPGEASLAWSGTTRLPAQVVTPTATSPHGSTARSSSSTTPHAVASSPARNPAMTIPSYCGTRGWSIAPGPST